MLDDIRKLSDRIRAEFGIPASKEPLPDLMEMQEPNKEQGDVLYKPLKTTAEDDFYSPFFAYANPVPGWTSCKVKVHYTPLARPVHDPLKPDTEPFETNMMEALVGWRAWRLDMKKKALRSQNDFFQDDEKHLLRPGIPMVAACGKTAQGNVYGWTTVYDPAAELPVIPDHAVPAEFCSCGIYAKDTLENLEGSYQGIYGQVYGWGRYVRGDQGWRAQYMYPKRFYLTRKYARTISPEVIDFLRTYRVPIFVEQPTMIYNPEEDGYEYRDNEENWNFGADTDPDAEED